MLIRRYGDLPVTYAPDVGETVMARRVVTDRFERAWVLAVSRRDSGRLWVKIQWAAGPKVNTIDYVVTSVSGQPQLIRQINKGQPPHEGSAAEEG